MKQIYFAATLLLLFIAVSTANAQERGDGKAESVDKNPDGIISGRTGTDRPGGFEKGKSSNAWFNKNMAQAGDKSDNRPFVHGVSDFGIKLGGNFQEIGTSPFTSQFNPGIVGGLYFRRFYRVTAIEIEALASSAHYISSQPAGYFTTHASDSVTKSEFRTIYLSVPMMFQLQVIKRLFVEVGPQYSYLISSADKNGAFTKIYKKDDVFYKSEFSGVVGLEYLYNRKFKIDVRYVKGITDVNNNLYPKAYLEWTINSLQATVSYRLY